MKEQTLMNEKPVHLQIGKLIPETLLKRSQKYKKNVAQRNSFTASQILLRKNFSILKNCPICTSPSLDLGEVQSFTYSKCLKCSHIFSKVVPSEIELENLYNPNESKDSKINTSTSHQRDTYILDFESAELRSSGIEKLKANWISSKYFESKTKGFAIDIGSGSGIFLGELQSLGFQVLGIEMDKQLALESQRKGVPTLNQKVTDESWPSEIKKADIVSLLNVVEHIANPLTFISSLARLLKPGAMIAMEVPRAESISTYVNLALPHDTYRHITPPEHLHIFSDESLSQLIEKSGLSLTDIWNFGSDAVTLLDLILPKNARCIDEVFESSFVNKLQQLIDEFGMSDNRIVIAEKR